MRFFRWLNEDRESYSHFLDHKQPTRAPKAKALTVGEPRYLADLLNLQNDHVGMDLQTSDDPFQLEVLRATSERCFAERTFLYIAPRRLNITPASLK